MFNVKYLEYFIVSADMGSFSKAAAVLYTTQSNVSKGIKTLEEYVGDRLFVRRSKGIALTPQGKRVYKYASRIMEDMGALRDLTKSSQEEWIHISTNPSSWVADRFVEFYNLHSRENLHWQILTGSVERIMRRVGDYKDELGLVYVMEAKKASFRYQLSRNHLEFIPMAEARPMIYLGKGHPAFGGEGLTEADMEDLRFVQGYRDAFSQSDRGWMADAKAKERPRRNVAVVTDSDYIMERLLLNAPMANISTNYLTNGEHRIVADGIPLKEDGENDSAAFGCLKRENEALSQWSQRFVDYMQEVLGGFLRRENV